ncbi:23S rRNA (uracil1939-C5)-methyltransferase [Anaerotaenia torta]|uniref:23S rRNA (uracil(1939)-C(5))-methyltransferase RlmD n=1 Tax=Anaerotaenia torta TaxID=433293 RepID=UPI003D25DA1E
MQKGNRPGLGSKTGKGDKQAQGNRPGQDYHKANKRKEKYDYEAFEDFDTFVKATGWKKSAGSVSVKTEKRAGGKKQEKRTVLRTEAVKTDRDRGIRGLQSGRQQVRNGQNHGQNLGQDLGQDLGQNVRNKERKKEGNREGNREGSKEGNKAGNKAGKKSPAKKGDCAFQKACGACNIGYISYEKHLEEKQKEVEKLLKGYGKVEQIIGMAQPDHYRHKVHVVFDHDRKGNPISGIYEEGTHRVIAVERCLIHNEKADAIIATIRGMLKSFKILTYDEDSGYGLFRHVLIRVGYHSGEIMVVLVLASPILPSKNNFVKALRKEHPEITTIVLNVNDKHTSMVLGEKEQVLYGKGFIEDSLCEKVFRISPKSFYQVNPGQIEILYRKAIELAGLTGNETVVDAYCGTGTIGLIAADHAKRVISVELNKDAVRDAVVNAKRNDTNNIEFYQNDAGVFLSQMAEKGDTVDVIFMDPPRTGSTPEFLNAAARISPKKVVYISCNPVTLARDLEHLTKKGYKVKNIIPVDMFAWTSHVETVCLMSRKESK